MDSFLESWISAGVTRGSSETLSTSSTSSSLSVKKKNYNYFMNLQAILTNLNHLIELTTTRFESNFLHPNPNQNKQLIFNFWRDYWTKIELTLGYQVFKSRTVVSTLSQLKKKRNENNVHHLFCLTKKYI